MGPLITIETVPIKIEYVEKESSHSSSLQSARLNISRDDNAMTIQSSPISIPVTDTFEFSSSADWSNLTYTATAQYSGDGNLSMNVQMQSSAANTYQYQQFGRGIDNIAASFPSIGTGSSSQKENMKIDFDMSQFFGTNSVDTSFYPPDLELKVVARADVVVKYVGDPLYFPRSSNPNYKASEATEPTYFPLSANPEFEASEATGPVYFPESSNPNYDTEMAQIYDTKTKLDLRA